MSELKYLAAPSVAEKIIIAREKRPIATSGWSVVSRNFVELAIQINLPQTDLPDSDFH